MRAFLTELPLECRRQLVELVESTNAVGTWVWHLADNTFVWSPRQFSHFGLDISATGTVTYDVWLGAIHQADRDRVQAAMTRTIATGEPLKVTFRVIRRNDQADGSDEVHWLQAKGRLVRDAEKSQIHMVGISRDVTIEEQEWAVRDARRELAEMEDLGSGARFDVYFQSSPDCLALLKVEGGGRFTYQMINPTAAGMIDMAAAAVCGLTPFDVLGPENGRKMVDTLCEVVETGQPVSYTPTFSYSTGTVMYDATYMPLKDRTGRIRTILVRARDITREKKMEADLRQSQKMEALGLLAAGVSHDFNNLLTALGGCFNRLSRMDLPEEVVRILGMGSHALKQGEALTRRLLTFSRKQELQAYPMNLNACVAGSLTMIRSSMPGVKMEACLTEGACDVRADGGLIEACLLNLCINARDAMPVGCEIVIETKIHEPRDALPPALPEGTYVSVSVRDNGPGMSEEVLARALEPFFTTKGEGMGTGLGLSTVYGIARGLGGDLAIRSRIGEGTEVLIYLPRAV